jgi:hypothetical protein
METDEERKKGKGGKKNKGVNKGDKTGVKESADIYLQEQT